MSMELNAKVIHRMEFAPGNFVLRIAPKDWDIIEFKPGQYAVLGLSPDSKRHPSCDQETQNHPDGKLIRRAYSIASSSLEKQYLEFYITVVKSGALTPRLYNLSIGDPLWLGPKCTGLLTIENVPESANVVLIATGTGVAPYMSMIRTLAAKNSLNRKIAVIHGARHSWDLGYQIELDTMAKYNSNFFYFPVISEPQDEHIRWQGTTGRVQNVWQSELLEKSFGTAITPENTHIFLCGNPYMIDDMAKMLEEQNFQEDTRKNPGQLHLERYW